MQNALIDLTGQRFGVWLVIEQAPRRDNKTRWLCECQECGAQRSLRSTTLRTSQYATCSRTHVMRISAPSPLKKPNGYAAGTERFNEYRSVARKRGLTFSLSRAEFIALSQQNCHYCESPPVQISRRRHYNGVFIYNGIDRKDSHRGYEPGNCLPCCGTCNVMKQDLPYTVFLEHIAQIASRHPTSPATSVKQMGLGFHAHTRPAQIEAQDRDAARAIRYNAIAALHREGKSLEEIASALNISRMTAYRGLIGSQSIQPRTYNTRTKNV